MVTTAAAVLVLAQGVLSVSLVGRLLGALAVGEYLLIGRVQSWLSSGAQLGIGVALPRYVAAAVDRHESDQLGYLAGGLLLLLGAAGLLGSILLLGKTVLARWLFGSSQMVYLILPLVLALLGQAAHTAVYGYYRGRLWMHWASALQVLNIALIPIAAIVLLYRDHSVALIISVAGAAVLVVSSLFLIPAARASSVSDMRHIQPVFSELLHYGIARVPGEFAGGALFALGPVIAAHYVPIEKVSYLLLGLGMLMAVSASVSPCGTVLLSKLSMMLARNQIREVRERLEQFISGVLELSVFLCLQVVVFADIIVRVWVGAKYLDGVGVIDVTLLSIPFFLFFVAARSAIDAASVVAHNAHNGYIALAVFLGLSGVAVRFVPPSRLLESIAGALMVANAVLAWRTAVVARRLLGLCIPWRRCLLPLILAGLLGSATYLVRRAMGWHVGIFASVLLVSAASAVFLLGSRKLGSTWLEDSWRLLVAGRVNAKEVQASGF